jgi:hypothetical protein
MGKSGGEDDCRDAAGFGLAGGIGLRRNAAATEALTRMDATLVPSTAAGRFR